MTISRFLILSTKILRLYWDPDSGLMSAFFYVKENQHAKRFAFSQKAIFLCKSYRRSFFFGEVEPTYFKDPNFCRKATSNFLQRHTVKPGFFSLRWMVPSKTSILIQPGLCNIYCVHIGEDNLSVIVSELFDNCPKRRTKVVLNEEFFDL